MSVVLWELHTNFCHCISLVESCVKRSFTETRQRGLSVFSCIANSQCNTGSRQSQRQDRGGGGWQSDMLGVWEGEGKEEFLLEFRTASRSTLRDSDALSRPKPVRNAECTAQSLYPQSLYIAVVRTNRDKDSKSEWIAKYIKSCDPCDAVTCQLLLSPSWFWNCA